MNEDFDASEFLPKDTRLKGDLLESSGWDGHPVTIIRVGRKSYEASADRPAETKVRVFFRELGDYALECNATQLKKLIELFGSQVSGWVGNQVVLVSTDGGIFNGQPCKKITVKQVMTAAPPMMTGIAPPPSVAAPVSLDTSLPPVGLDGGDPFDDDNVTADQLAKIETLCQQLNMNAVLTSQNQYNKNPANLTYSQAADFLVKLQAKAAQNSQAVAAMTR